MNGLWKISNAETFPSNQEPFGKLPPKGPASKVSSEDIITPQRVPALWKSLLTYLFLSLNKLITQTLTNFVFMTEYTNSPWRETHFDTAILCLYLADPATFLASNIFLWEQLVYSGMETINTWSLYFVLPH